MEIINGVFGVGSLVPPIREILNEIDRFNGQEKVPLFQ